MIDAGVNLCSSQYKNYLPTLIQHAQEAELTGLITISNGINEWKANLNHTKSSINTKSAKKKEFKIWTTIGIHPHNAKEVRDDFVYIELEKLAQQNNVVAIGECGLDYNRMFSPKENQKIVFQKQIEIAAKLNKPLYLHDRDSSEDFYTILKEAKRKYPDLQALVHCYTGDAETMKKYLELDFYIGITGWICDYRRNQDLLEAVKELPLDRLILETDSPWLIPKAYGKQWKTRRNQPDAIYLVSAELAKIWGIDEQIIIKHALENTKKLFDLS